MASRKPIVRQTAWLSLIPQILFIGALYIIYSFFIESKLFSIYLTLLTYLFLSITLRSSLSRYHRKGMTLVKKEKYEQAIEAFQKSYSFFSKYTWIDQYRFITMLSSSKISYREMALLNIAFCYSQIDNGKNSKDYYLKTIQYFPNSEVAKASLKMIRSIKNQNE